MRLEIIEKTRKYRYSKTKIAGLFHALASHFGIPADFELAVFFTGKTSIRKANRDFRRKDAPTDVLSFPLNSEKEIGAFRRGKTAESPFPMGDILLCPDFILERNVIGCERDLNAEVVFLLIHGFMHIIGYDHGEGDFAGSKMERDALRFMGSHLQEGLYNGVIKRRS